MGNTQGLKIKNYSNNEIFKDIKINENNERIIPYVHFITKLNRFQVENFPKHHLIREFTIINFITEKQNVIHIDSMEAGFFLKGLEYSFEPIPEKSEFILITNILENSASQGTDIKPNYTVLLGDEEKYFESLDNIAENLKAKKYKFLFFDVAESKSFIIDYKEKLKSTKDEDNKKKQVSLGIECGTISRLRLLKLIDKVQKEIKVQQGKRDLDRFITNENVEKFVKKDGLEEERKEVNLTEEQACTKNTENSDNLNSDKAVDHKNQAEPLEKQVTESIISDKAIEVRLDEKSELKQNNEIIIEKEKENVENSIPNPIVESKNHIEEEELKNEKNEAPKVFTHDSVKNNKFAEREVLDEEISNNAFEENSKKENCLTKREIISNLLNEKEIINEDTEIFKNKSLIENKIDNLQKANSNTDIIQITAASESFNENTDGSNLIKGEATKGNLESETEVRTKIQQENLPNEEFISKTDCEKINIIINKNVINLSNRKIEKKYMKHLLVYDFVDSKTNRVDFFKNAGNDKINEKYAKQMNQVKK